jgi:hypothetical protein
MEVPSGGTSGWYASGIHRTTLRQNCVIEATRPRRFGRALPNFSGRRSDSSISLAPLSARIETLEAELAKLEATAAVHRADFEREHDRRERLMAEVLKTTAEHPSSPGVAGVLFLSHAPVFRPTRAG